MDLNKSDNKVLECFLDIENELNLFEKNINNYYFWIYLRHIIIDDTIQMITGRDAAQNNNKLGNTQKEKIISIFRLFINVIKSICRIKFIDRKDVMIIGHQRKIKNEYGRYECKYTELIHKTIENSIVVEFPEKWKHYYPTENENILYLDYIKVASSIKTKILRKINKDDKIKKFAIEMINNIDNMIQSKLEIKIEKDKYIEYVVYGFYIHKVQTRLLTKLLTKLQPQKIIEVVSYSPDNMMINEVADKLDIETIELQHGTMGNEHIAYNFRTKRCIPQFPKRILLFSDYWKETTRFPIDKKNIISVGFPYLEEEINKRKDKVIQKKNGKKKILFISQASIGVKLVKLALDLNNLINNDIMKNEFEILFKLHPR